MSLTDQEFAAELAVRLEAATVVYLAARDELHDARGRLDALAIQLKALADRIGPEAKAHVRELLATANVTNAARREANRRARRTP